ncbi:hypothetical protein NL676_022662 [Syzygium grande]|nr:hypothetical protein NL676_022662 [Syzygium grande]
MAETGVVRFHGNLDPAAQEFRPARNPNSPPFFAPAPAPQPPPLPAPAPAQQLYYPPPYEVRVVPFQYHHHQQPPAPMPPPPGGGGGGLRGPADAAALPDGDAGAGAMERARRDGVVTVHFYDLRHAKRALRTIREQHMQRQCRLRDHYGAAPAAPAEDPCCRGGAPPPAGGPALWAQFVVPAVHAIPEGQNQGTIVVFNLDPDVSAASLRELFEPFGPVKELRETPLQEAPTVRGILRRPRRRQGAGPDERQGDPRQERRHRIQPPRRLQPQVPARPPRQSDPFRSQFVVPL